MIDVEEPQMRVEHGEFYIAEVLLGNSKSGKMDNEKIIVTEVRMKIELSKSKSISLTFFQDSGSSSGSTGMMWLSEEIDIMQLIKNYDLESVGNLVSCTPDAPHHTVKLDV